MNSEEQGVERIRIPNRVANSPVALPDIMMARPFSCPDCCSVPPCRDSPFRPRRSAPTPGAPRRTGSGGSAVRKIEFLAVYGADVSHLPAISLEARRAEIAIFTRKLNDVYRPMEVPRPELAERVNEALTRYNRGASPGQRVETSDSIRSFMQLAQFLFHLRRRRVRLHLGRRRDIPRHRYLRAARHRPRVQPPQGILQGARGAGSGLSRSRGLRRTGSRAVRVQRAAAPATGGSSPARRRERERPERTTSTISSTARASSPSSNGPFHALGAAPLGGRARHRGGDASPLRRAHAAHRAERPLRLRRGVHPFPVRGGERRGLNPISAGSGNDPAPPEHPTREGSAGGCAGRPQKLAPARWRLRHFRVQLGAPPSGQGSTRRSGGRDTQSV